MQGSCEIVKNIFNRVSIYRKPIVRVTVSKPDLKVDDCRPGNALRQADGEEL